jgi:hypothetical protein
VKFVCGRLAVLSVAAALILGAAGPACTHATPADMAVLPVVVPFECLICHVAPDPGPASAALNLFGLDFLAGGRVWNAELAAMDSDGDGCLNGVELGDADGDGLADGNVTTLATNPGDPGDCSRLGIDASTWGALKAMFDNR